MQYKFKNSQLYRRILVCFLVLMLPTLALGVYFLSPYLQQFDCRGSFCHTGSSSERFFPN